MDQGQLFIVLVAVAGALGTAVWYMIRRADSRLDRERDERIRASEEDRKLFLELHERAQNAWMEAMDKERADAKSDRHEFRDEISKWVNAFHAYKLEAAEKFVNHMALEKALAPLEEGFRQVRSTLERLFDELKGKADKHLGGT